MNELLKVLTAAHAMLAEHEAKILSIDISANRLSVHVDGKTFTEMVDELKPTVEGSFAKSGYHCGFVIPNSVIHIHTLLQ